MITKKQMQYASEDYEVKNLGEKIHPTDAFEDGAKWAIGQLQPEIDALKSEQATFEERNLFFEDQNAILGQTITMLTRQRNVYEAENERLKAENDRLRESLEHIKRTAIVEYAESAACRIIASEIQKLLNP